MSALPTSVIVRRGDAALFGADGAWRQAAASLAGVPYYLTTLANDCFRSRLMPDAEWIAIELHRDSQCVGVVLAQLGRTKLSGVPLRSLSLPYHSHFILSDLLMAPVEHIDAYWPQMASALAQHGVRWDVIHCPAVVGSGAAIRAALDLGESALTRRIRSSNYFDCTVPYAQISAGFSELLRKNLQKGWRRIERSGKLEIVSVRGSLTTVDAFDDFLRIEASGWKGQQGTAISCDTGTLSFWRDMFLLQSEEMHAEVNLMKLDGQAIAGQLCLVSNRTCYVHKIAYDEAYKRLSPGQLLIEDLLRRSCENSDIDEVSVVSDASWHSDWSPCSQDVYEVWMFREIWVARFASGLIRMRDGIRSLLRT